MSFGVVLLRLLRRDFRTSLVDKVHICRRISIEKVDAGIWSKARRLTDVMRGDKYEISGVVLNRLLFDSSICTAGYTVERIGQNLRGESLFRKLTGGNVRWVSRLWRTKLFNRLW
jgi:hypothetical protein